MRLKSACSGAWIAAAAVAVDRVGKAFAARMAPGETLDILPGVLRLRSTTNSGMAFSLFSGQTLPLTIVSALVVAALTAWLFIRPQSQSALLRAGLWMAVGGGLGNLYDRIAYGCVIDFIEPTFVRFAVFNPADVFVCVGVALAALALILEERRKESARERTEH